MLTDPSFQVEHKSNRRTMSIKGVPKKIGQEVVQWYNIFVDDDGKVEQSLMLVFCCVAQHLICGTTLPSLFDATSVVTSALTQCLIKSLEILKKDSRWKKKSLKMTWSIIMILFLDVNVKVSTSSIEMMFNQKNRKEKMKEDETDSI